MLPITAADVAEAIAQMKRGKAGAESGVVADVFKRLDAGSVEALAQVFDQWKEKGRVPDGLNAALLRLLPKSDKGLADMSDCRPIALMEHITKLYEHVMIRRVTAVVMDRGMLHRGQYGAVPCTGVGRGAS